MTNSLSPIMKQYNETYLGDITGGCLLLNESITVSSCSTFMQQKATACLKIQVCNNNNNNNTNNNNNNDFIYRGSSVGAFQSSLGSSLCVLFYMVA